VDGRGNSPVITVDGKFVVFAVAPLKAEVDKAKKEKKKPEWMEKGGSYLERGKRGIDSLFKKGEN
jgi:hypothetical protein